MFRIDLKDAVPVWKQIEEGVRRLVGSGVFRPGGPVPSVRDMARELRVNPMTVSKAYLRLADAGVLEIRRGAGTFVATGAPAMSRGEKTRALRGAASRYVSVAITLAVSKEDATREVATAWDGTTRGGGETR